MTSAGMLASSTNILIPDATLIVEVVVFLGVLWILAKWVYPPMVRAIDARQQRIAQSMRDAEEAEHRLAAVREEVERMLEEARSQSRDIVVRAHREASAEAGEVRARAREEAAAFVEQARDEIAAERDAALRELRAQFGALVVAAAAKVLGEAIDQRAHRALIERSLESLEILR